MHGLIATSNCHRIVLYVTACTSFSLEGIKTDAKMLLALRHSSPTISRRGGGTPGTLTTLYSSSCMADTIEILSYKTRYI